MTGMTRRNFSRFAAAGCAAGRLLATPFRLNIGVGSFSYHTLSLDEMIVRLVQNQVREIELSHGEFMLMQPPREAMVTAARRKFDAAGIRCVSYYTATIKNGTDLDYAVRYAKLLGASNVSGDATGRILHEIDRRFKAAGLSFGIHNHWFAQGFPYESAEEVANAISGLSQTVGATLDVGQMAACGHDPVQAIQLLASRLKLVHLKDVQAAGAEHNVLLGTGVAKIPAVMEELKRIRFSGLVAIEFEKEGNDDEEMRQELAYARTRA